MHYFRSFTSLGCLASVLACLCGPAAAQGQFSYTGCPDVSESQFKYVPLISRSATPGITGADAPLLVDPTLKEPLHMGFDLKSDNKVDIYFTERAGNVKRYNGTTNTVATIGQIQVSTTGEMGLVGLALDPGFKTNKWLYVFYTSPTFELRLARFTLTAAGMMDAASEKILLRIQSIAHRHMGGALAFDADGNLWITTGNDANDYPGDYSETSAASSSEGSAANLADLRGGVLRIHPDNSDKGYTVPPGNFSQYWSDYFRGKGNATLADEYADPAKVRPEVYAKGTRNAYSISVDASKHWVSYGNFGINTQDTYTEAHYLLTHPAFGGYPYFAGGFGPGNGSGYYELWSGPGNGRFKSAHPGLTESIAGPMNNSIWNKGPKQLPPVTPGMHTYVHGSGAGAVTGPFYHYNGSSSSTVKWPPNFDGSWMVTDFIQGTGNNGFRGMKIFKLSANGDRLTDSLKFFQNSGWFRPISMEQGPDGAIYVAMYHSWFDADAGTHIGRIEYTGSCHPVTTVPSTQPKAGLAHAWPLRLDVSESGPFSLVVRDIGGREWKSLPSEQGPRSYSLAELAPQARGILLVTISSLQGIRTLSLYKD